MEKREGVDRGRKKKQYNWGERGGRYGVSKKWVGGGGWRREAGEVWQTPPGGVGAHMLLQL